MKRGDSDERSSERGNKEKKIDGDSHSMREKTFTEKEGKRQNEERNKGKNSYRKLINQHRHSILGRNSGKLRSHQRNDETNRFQKRGETFRAPLFDSSPKRLQNTFKTFKT